MKVSETPIISLKDYLLISLQRELNDIEALQLQDGIMTRLRNSQASGIILDVSGIEIIDSYIARVFNDIGYSAKAMGAATVLAGLQPAVAMTLVEMGVEMSGIHTTMDLDSAINYLDNLKQIFTTVSGPDEKVINDPFASLNDLHEDVNEPQQ